MKNTVRIILIIMVCSMELFPQEGVYFYGINSRPVEQLADAFIFKEVKEKSVKKYIIKTNQKTEDHWKQVTKEKIKISADGTQTIFHYANSFLPKKIYRDYEKISPMEYAFKEFNINGVIRTGSSSRFLPLHLEGEVYLYHPNGVLRSKSVYRDNQLISNENWLSDGSKYIDSVFYSVDQEPEYQMGDAFFKSYVVKKLEKSGFDLTQIADEVEIGWVVMEDGTLDGIIATKGKSRQLNEFLVNSIRELPGTWTTAMLDGSPVRYYMAIPLNFMQREASFQEVEMTPGGVMFYNKY